MNENEKAAFDAEELAPAAEKRVEVTLPNGEKSLEQPAGEDAGFVRDSTGAPHKTHGLDLGAGQVQQKVDQANASGHFPADGSPPSGHLTVSAVTGNTVLQDLAAEGGTASEDAAGYDNTGGDSSDGDDDSGATDAAQAKADELGVDISEVEGTGQDGRVLVSDVEAHANK